MALITIMASNTLWIVFSCSQNVVDAMANMKLQTPRPNTKLTSPKLSVRPNAQVATETILSITATNNMIRSFTSQSMREPGMNTNKK